MPGSGIVFTLRRCVSKIVQRGTVFPDTCSLDLGGMSHGVFNPPILLRRSLLFVMGIAVMASCSPANEHAGQNADWESWDEVVTAARGATLDIGMWRGDPYINAFMGDVVSSRLKKDFDIDVRFISSRGSELVSALITELEAGSSESAFDMVWINGETFFQLRQIDALFGPFTHLLPHIDLVDFEDPLIAFDFQQPIGGYEAPWGTVQFILIYDTLRVGSPPLTTGDLAKWVQNNPGRFTFDASFTGMTFLKSLLMEFADSPEALQGPFNEARYDAAASRLWGYLLELKPHLWKGGRSFPAGVAQLHHLFAGGEIDFTMSNNDGEVDNKVLQGVFPPSTRGYVPAFGSIRNTHYWGIVRHARDKAAALVAVNFLLSPEAQLLKLRPEIWGDGTVLDPEKLAPDDRDALAAASLRRHVPPATDLRRRARMELAPEYMIRLYADFRRTLLEESSDRP